MHLYESILKYGGHNRRNLSAHGQFALYFLVLKLEAVLVEGY